MFEDIENQYKSMIINSKSIQTQSKISDIAWTSIQNAWTSTQNQCRIDAKAMQNPYKTKKFNEHDWQCMKFKGNHWKSMQSIEISWNLLKINRNLLEINRNLLKMNDSEWSPTSSSQSPFPNRPPMENINESIFTDAIRPLQNEVHASIWISLEGMDWIWDLCYPWVGWSRQWPKSRFSSPSLWLALPSCPSLRPAGRPASISIANH